MRRSISLSHLLLSAALAAGCSDLGVAPRADDSPDLPATDAAPPVDLLAEWAGCMTLEQWEGSRMGAWANKPSSLGTICSDCHADGLAFFYANPASAQMFETNRYRRFVTGFFTVTTDEETGLPDIAPAWSKLVAKGEGQNNHPLYAVGPGERYFEYLEVFARATRDARTAGLCGPPSEI
ncbi:MAG TPA: hypothetical protein VFU21_25530 [Kofleriaceae bacterium]|nr:hypothetical protein [Kofleriaceae bacterium]